MQGISLIVYGAPKTGKSWLGDTTPAPRLVLDAEGGSRFTPSTKKTWDPAREKPPEYDESWSTCLVSVNTYQAVRQAYDWLYSGQHPFRSVVIDSISETQQRCFTPDTEILTPRGWIALPDLHDDDFVAQAELSAAGQTQISFVRPVARQQLSHQGSIIDFSGTSRACRLAVTPGHRMAFRYQDDYHVASAEDMTGSMRRFPVSGYMEGDAPPVKDDEIRLAAAIQADGTISPKYGAYYLTVRRPAKIKRMREILGGCGIKWTESAYPIAEGASKHAEDIRFWIPRDEAACIFRLLDRDKTWSWNLLTESLHTRQLLVQETGHWDGSFLNKAGSGTAVEYRSQSRKNIDVMAAVAAISGYSSTISPCHGKIILTPRTWARHSTGYVRRPYDGQVYCVSVPATFVVVRRNGVTTIAGNCVDDIAGTNQMQTADWGTLLRTVSNLVRGYRDLITHPVKPLDCVMLIAMTDENQMPKRPLLQGKLASFLPYYTDLCGYLGAYRREDGTPFRRLILSPSTEYIAGERVGGRLGTYVDIPDISEMLQRIAAAEPQ